MLFSTLAASAALVGSALAYQPFPLSDGFPSPSPANLKKIEQLAGGTLPNTPLPNKLTPAATVTLQLIALNEIFEVAFFNDLLSNITHNVPGYELHGYEREYVIKTITTVLNQEKLHYLGANGILANSGETQIAPCAYKFPVSNFLQAITLANTFTDVVIGVLPMAQTQFAVDGGDETGLVNLLGSIISQESEQDGYYRTVQKKVPSAAPFLTTEGPAFAFTFLQGVIIPGSCPGVELVGKSIPTFAALNVLSKLSAKDTTATFSVHGKISTSENAVSYISGQNIPVTVPIKSVKYSRGVSTFTASFPFASEGFAQGLSIAAVIKKCDKTPTTVAEVSAMTVYAPGIIEVN